jgi:ABC-type transporter Mla maintaining outer membrane lipid asymmetry ATPase subunit MlaF
VECLVPGLSVRGLTWCAARHRYGLAPDPLELGRREVGTVRAADPLVARSLADVLAGLAAPEDGELATGGRVALVPPGGALLPDLTVAANLALGLRAHSAVDLRGRVVHAARLLQVEGALELHPDRLSAAQQLRAGMARALAADPDLVVLEDRTGMPPCGPAVAAAADRVAVLVITDDLSRVRSVPEREWAAVPL